MKKPAKNNAPRRTKSTTLLIEQLECRQVPSITFHGGAVLPHVEVEGAFYGSYWGSGAGAQQGSDLNTYLQYIVNSSFMDDLAEYGVGRGTLVDNGIADPGISGGQTVDDTQIRSMLLQNISRGFLQAPDLNRLYIVFTAPNVTVTDGGQNSIHDFFGYHDSFVSPSLHLIRYAVVAHPIGNGDANGLNDFQTLTWVTSHEIAESATNPDNGGWYDTKTDDEIADVCNSVNDAGVLNGYVITGVWSVQQNACIIPANAQFLMPSMSGVPSFDLRSRLAGAFFGSDEYQANLILHDYQQLLGRAPLASEVTFWLTAMQTGISDKDVLADFTQSPEYYQRAGGTDRAWIDGLYHDLLGRTPSTGEENAWLAVLASGASRGAIASGFAHSAEYQTRLIMSDYQSYLGRAASAAEVAAWMPAFNQGSTDEQIATLFVSSDEFYFGQGGTVESWLTGLYRDILGRPADKDGFAAWDAYIVNAMG